MSAITCPQCQSNGRWLFSASDLNRKVTRDKFDYYRCKACRLVFLSPLPPDLSGFYPPTYHEIPASTDGLRPDLERESFKIDAIKAHTDGRALLEIGPSLGRFAFLAKSSGFDVSAFEIDQSCCRFLNEIVGIRAFHTSNILESVRGAGTFDAIAMWHSLEHLPDPWCLVDMLPDKLNEGGLLVIASPNPESLQFRLFGKYWVHLDAPRHVELIPPALLTRRLSNKGLARVHFSTSDQGAKDCNGLGWQVSPEHFFRGHAFWHYTRRIWLRLIRLLVSPIENVSGLGSAYTLVFRKPHRADPPAAPPARRP